MMLGRQAHVGCGGSGVYTANTNELPHGIVRFGFGVPEGARPRRMEKPP
jgi:hypothetical protein